MEVFERKNRKHFLISLSIILLIGLIMVYSSSYIYAKENFGSSTHFLFKHVIFIILGASVAFGLTKSKLNFWLNYSYGFQIAAIVLLAATFTGLGANINGSARWIQIFGFSLQPGEFIKYSTVLAATKFFSEYQNFSIKDNWKRSALFIIPLGLLLVQPDFGTFSITVAIITYACFLSNFSRRWFYSSLTVGAALFGFLLVAAPYRVKRLLVFLDPWADPHNSGFQIIQSYLAFANGHIFGQGIGNSNEKLFYLPEMYNDFIFSVIGEEMGLVGVLAVVGIFLSFIFFGYKLAASIKSSINQKLVCTIIFLIGLQAFLNMGVVLGLLPTKGLNLPFISYGGSSIIANLIGIGLIFSALSKKSNAEEQSESFTNYSQRFNDTSTVGSDRFRTRTSATNSRSSYFSRDSKFNQNSR